MFYTDVLPENSDVFAIVYCGRNPIAEHSLNKSEDYISCDIQRLTRADTLPFEAESVDCIIMPETLNYMDRTTQDSFGPNNKSELLRHAYAALKPGGLIIIGVSNFWNFDKLKNYFKRPTGVSFKRGVRIPSTYFGYQKMLVDAGFRVDAAYAAIPNLTKPRHIVSVEPQASRQYFRKDLTASTGSSLSVKQLAKTFLYMAGVSVYVQDAFIFVGVK